MCRMDARSGIAALAWLGLVLAGCYGSYARSAERDASADTGAEPAPDGPACTVGMWGRTVEVGIDVPTRIHPHHDLAWAGDSFAIAWDDEEEEGMASSVSFSRLSDEGEPLGEERTVSDDAPESTALNPEVEWTGSGFGVKWETYHFPQRIRFRPLGADGRPAGASTEVASGAPGHVWGIQSVMAWTGTHHVVAWPYEIEGPNAEGVVVVFVEPDGTAAGGPFTFSDGYTGHPDLDGRGGLAALLWSGESSTLSVVGAGGDVVAEVAWTGSAALGKHVAAGPGAYGIVWSLEGFFFRALDADGAPLHPTVSLNDENAGLHSAEVEWSEWGWVVVWQERWRDPDGRPSRLRAVLLEDDGTVILDEVLGEVESEGVAEPHVAWTGSEVGITWNGRDLTAATPSLLFTRIVCS
jgi:hypothetical protein